MVATGEVISFAEPQGVQFGQTRNFLTCCCPNRAGGAAVIVVRSRTASNPPVRNDCDKHDGYRKGAVNV